MSCDVWRPWLDAYADESCSAEELAGIEVHLRACPACALEALHLVQSKRATRAAAMRFAPTPEFRLRVESELKKAGSAAPRQRAWLPVWTPVRLPSFAASAAVLALIAISAVLWTRHAAREQATAELLDLHVATLASSNPVDVVSTDRHTVKPWFQGKLPFTFNLPELQDSPYKLLGGKLIYFGRNPGAQLLFELGKHRISVFILEEQPGGVLSLPGIPSGREKGFSVESWQRGGLRYAVVGDAGSADLHALSEMLRAAAGS